MKNRKLNLDRPPLQAEQIRSKMNFNQILESYKTVKPTIWKSPWFYGPAGLATIALAVSLSLTAFQTTQNTAHDQTITLTEKLPEDTECIHPPLASEPEYETHVFDPRTNFRIVLKGGTEVFIPAGSVHGSAEEAILKTREFYNKTGVFLSGVKMDCDQEAFESAGMIELRVFDRAGNALDIAADQRVFVSMPVQTADSSFGFWRLDEATGNWENYPANFVKQPAETSPQEVRTAFRERERELKTVNGRLAELRAPQKVDFKLPVEGKQRFDLSFDGRQYPELEKLRNVEFEVTETAAYDHSFTQKTWSKVELKRDDHNGYVAVFSRKNEQFSVHVRPVLTGKERDAAEHEFSTVYASYQREKEELEDRKETIEEAMQELRLRIEEQVVEQAEFHEANARKAVMASELKRRADFYITSFGFYNCDQKVNYPPPFVKQPVLAWEDSGEAISPDRIFVFDRRRNLRYTFGGPAEHGLVLFGLKHKSENLVLVIDKHNRVGVSEVDTHAEIPQKLTFRMIGDSHLSPEEIRKYVEGETAAV